MDLWKLVKRAAYGSLISAEGSPAWKGKERKGKETENGLTLTWEHMLAWGPPDHTIDGQ